MFDRHPVRGGARHTGLVTWPTPEATEHLELLADRHGVQLHYVASPQQAQCHLGTRQVWVAQATTGPRYLSGLHEVGHIVDRKSVRYWDSGDELLCEAAAWAWAIKHARSTLLRKITERGWREVAGWLGSYLPGPAR